MPAFLLGSLMAFEIDRLQALGARLAASTVVNRAVKALLVAVCVVSMTAVWWVRPDSPVVEHGLRAVVAAGACIAVGLPLVLGSLRAFLDTPVMQGPARGPSACTSSTSRSSWPRRSRWAAR